MAIVGAMPDNALFIDLTQAEKKQYKQWLNESFAAAVAFNGSEGAEQALFSRLQLMEDFIKARIGDIPTEEIETSFAIAASGQPAHPATINALLQEASDGYYGIMEKAGDLNVLLDLLESGGAVIRHHDGVFARGGVEGNAIESLHKDSQTDQGEEERKKFERRTQPRLALLIRHLKEEGIYTDDLVVHVPQHDKNLLRLFPYVIVQIPRLKKEIAVCDRIGDVTFISDRLIGPHAWAYFKKDQLSAKTGITTAVFHDEERWWRKISKSIFDHKLTPSQRRGEKLEVADFAERPLPYDIALIKESILAYRLDYKPQKGKRSKWPTNGDGPVEHGPYAGLTTWSALDRALHIGARGLEGGSSLPELCQQVSDENNLDYYNFKDQENLEIEKIMECILAYRLAHPPEDEKPGKWPSHTTGAVTEGPYAGKETWASLHSAVTQGLRGITEKTSLPKLCEAVSDKYDLDYTNRLNKPDLEISKIKECILAHYLETHSWPKDKLGTVEYGPYAGQETWLGISNALFRGSRGLPKGVKLSELSQQVAEENDLPYKKGAGWKKQPRNAPASAPEFNPE